MIERLFYSGKGGASATDRREHKLDLEYAEAVREVSVACGELVEVELVLTPVDG